MTKKDLLAKLASMTDDELYYADLEFPEVQHMAGESRSGRGAAIWFLVTIDDEEMLYEEITIPDDEDKADDYDWSADEALLAELYDNVRAAAMKGA